MEATRTELDFIAFSWGQRFDILSDFIAPLGEGVERLEVRVLAVASLDASGKAERRVRAAKPSGEL